MDGLDSSRKYTVSRCLRCRNILVINANLGQRKCPRCGNRVTIHRTLSIRRFTAREASDIAKALKMREHSRSLG